MLFVTQWSDFLSSISKNTAVFANGMKTQTDGVNLIQGAFNYQQGFKSHQGDFLSHKLTTKAQNIPESILLVSERLLRKHHDGTGVDRQGQSVVEVHVLQPVVINLNNNNNNNMGGGLL